MSEIHYKALEELIAQNEWWFSASELHGILSALVALNQEDLWKHIINIDFIQLGYEDLVPDLIANIKPELENSELNFQILLPESNVIQTEAGAIAEWTQGFYIANEYIKKENIKINLDTESQDFLDDIVAISQLDCDIEPSTDNELLLNNLVEHLRLGTLLLYAQTHLGK